MHSNIYLQPTCTLPRQFPVIFVQFRTVDFQRVDTQCLFCCFIIHSGPHHSDVSILLLYIDQPYRRFLSSMSAPYITAYAEQSASRHTPSHIKQENLNGNPRNTTCNKVWIYHHITFRCDYCDVDVIRLWLHKAYFPKSETGKLEVDVHQDVSASSRTHGHEHMHRFLVDVSRTEFHTRKFFTRSITPHEVSHATTIKIE